MEEKELNNRRLAAISGLNPYSDTFKQPEEKPGAKDGLITARIRNQLRIHWKWLKEKEDYNEVADFIDSCIRQALSRGSKNEEPNNQ